MENSIKVGDTVEVIASEQQLAKIGVLNSTKVLKEKKHKVLRQYGTYAVVNNFTLPVKFLKKCEE